MKSNQRRNLTSDQLPTHAHTYTPFTFDAKERIKEKVMQCYFVPIHYLSSLVSNKWKDHKENIQEKSFDVPESCWRIPQKAFSLQFFFFLHGKRIFKTLLFESVSLDFETRNLKQTYSMCKGRGKVNVLSAPPPVSVAQEVWNESCSFDNETILSVYTVTFTQSSFDIEHWKWNLICVWFFFVGCGDANSNSHYNFNFFYSANSFANTKKTHPSDFGRIVLHFIAEHWSRETKWGQRPMSCTLVFSEWNLFMNKWREVIEDEMCVEEEEGGKNLMETITSKWNRKRKRNQWETTRTKFEEKKMQKIFLYIIDVIIQCDRRKRSIVHVQMCNDHRSFAYLFPSLSWKRR